MKKGKLKKINEVERWEVGISFTKSIFRGGNRGTIVTVKDLKTGKSLRRSATATTKNEIRIAAERLSSELKRELEQ